MPYEVVLKFAAFALPAVCTGCIVPTGNGRAVNLAGSEKQMTFKQIAHDVIQPGMSRDDVLHAMRGYQVSTTQSSDAPPKLMDIFGKIEGERRYLYIAAWEGRHSWGVYPIKGEFGMVVRYDQSLRVDEAYDTDTSWANH